MMKGAITEEMESEICLHLTMSDDVSSAASPFPLTNSDFNKNQL